LAPALTRLSDFMQQHGQKLKSITMKKVFFISGLILGIISTAVNAQTVTVKADPAYDVYIDSRNYGDQATINNLPVGAHSVYVYQTRRGFLGIGKKTILISSGSFNLNRNDILVNTDQSGQLTINEGAAYANGNVKGQKGNGNGYGPYNNPGKGNKYGLYKQKKNRNKKNH
jgi:hypothetical protein